MKKSIYSAFTPAKTIDLPQIGRFSIERDSAFIGYNAKLRWVYDNKSIIGFKVWKSISPKVLLRKNYLISQNALERTTGLKSRDAQGTTLYNKAYFSQNSKVTFFNSETSRYDKQDEVDEVQESAKFVEVGFVEKNNSGEYEFIDKRVKFGETYYYCLTAVSLDFFETDPSDTVEVSIEDTRHPDPPTSVSGVSSGQSITIFIKNNKSLEDIQKYEIYRREDDESTYALLGHITADNDDVSFVDSTVLPGIRYYYKVYSVDFYENKSFFSEPLEVVHYGNYPLKADSKFPDFDVLVSDGTIIINGIKNHPNTIGHKIERQDSWRFEQGFNLKSYNGISWQNLYKFDNSGSYEFIDRSVSQGRSYRYRVTCIDKNGHQSKNFITPHIEAVNGTSLSFRDDKQLNIEEVNIVNFSAEVEDKKEVPLFVKIQWEISGNWSYLLIEIEKISTSGEEIEESERIKIVKIDNIHNSIFYEGLQEGSTYYLRMRVFDIDDDLVATTDQDTEVKVVL